MSTGQGKLVTFDELLVGCTFTYAKAKAGGKEMELMLKEEPEEQEDGSVVISFVTTREPIQKGSITLSPEKQETAKFKVLQDPAGIKVSEDTTVDDEIMDFADSVAEQEADVDPMPYVRMVADAVGTTVQRGKRLDNVRRKIGDPVKTFTDKELIDFLKYHGCRVDEKGSVWAPEIEDVSDYEAWAVAAGLKEGTQPVTKKPAKAEEKTLDFDDEDEEDQIPLDLTEDDEDDSPVEGPDEDELQTTFREIVADGFIKVWKTLLKKEGNTPRMTIGRVRSGVKHTLEHGDFDGTDTFTEWMGDDDKMAAALQSIGCDVREDILFPPPGIDFTTIDAPSWVKRADENEALGQLVDSEPDEEVTEDAPMWEDLQTVEECFELAAGLCHTLGEVFARAAALSGE
jgi:hypothetical protein